MWHRNAIVFALVREYATAIYMHCFPSYFFLSSYLHIIHSYSISLFSRTFLWRTHHIILCRLQTLNKKEQISSLFLRFFPTSWKCDSEEINEKNRCLRSRICIKYKHRNFYFLFELSDSFVCKGNIQTVLDA